jgi:hypothetical protein
VAVEERVVERLAAQDRRQGLHRHTSPPYCILT